MQVGELLDSKGYGIALPIGKLLFFNLSRLCRVFFFNKKHDSFDEKLI